MLRSVASAPDLRSGADSAREPSGQQAVLAGQGRPGRNHGVQERPTNLPELARFALAPSPDSAGAAFGETTDPGRYFARAVTDEILRGMHAAILAARPASLAGPPGIGKTMLLRVLCQRLDPELRTVQLPYAALEIEDFCDWVLGTLGVRTRRASQDPVEALGEAASIGRPLLLAIDDACALPVSTARSLAKIASELRGGLRLAMAAVDNYQASRVAAAFGRSLVEFELRAPLTRRETEDYLRARMARSASAMPLASDDCARIYGLSAGNPRLIHALVQHHLGLPPDVHKSWNPVASHGWIATPLDELDVDEAAPPGAAAALDAGESVEPAPRIR